MMLQRILALLLLSFALQARELTIDPPIPWETSCPPCVPEICDPCDTPSVIDELLAVDLVDPVYEDGVLTTDKGGVLQGNGIRIQGRKIIYTKKKGDEGEVYTIYCEGDLLIQYKGKALVGDTFFYDFLTESGTLTNGKTAVPPWYVGGDEIALTPCGDLIITGGYITTSEGVGEKEVVLKAPRLTITKNQLITAYGVNFQVKGIPLFYLPKLALDLSSIGQSPIGVEFGWGGFLGSHIGLRYQFLEWKNLKGFARIDGYFSHGLGGGIETTYHTPCDPLEIYTRSYYAHDLSIDDREKRNRYRFQGSLYDRFWNDSTSLEILYDKVSDAEMAADYQYRSFDLNTAERTQLELRRQEEAWIARFFAKARVNSFQSINQELPSFALYWHPVELFESGIIAENVFKAGFYSYAFSDDVYPAHDFHAGRVEVRPQFYRPLYLDPFVLTPEAGFIGIAFTNNQEGHSVGQALGHFGLRAETAVSRYYSSFKHVVEPYAHYHLYTPTRASLENQYIFTIEDAYAHLEYVRFGVRNSLFALGRAPLWIDVWTNAFIHTKEIHQVIQKGYVMAEWEPTCFLLVGTDAAWNFEHQLVDFFNARTEWTLSPDLAFAVEYRHRSRYDWRKANFYNFFLDAERAEEDLLASPLSERRDTLLFRIFCRLSPDHTARFQLRKGWNRFDQPPYTEYEITLGTRIFQHWRVLYTFEKRESDTRNFVTLKLDPGPP